MAKKLKLLGKRSFHDLYIDIVGESSVAPVPGTAKRVLPTTAVNTPTASVAPVPGTAERILSAPAIPTEIAATTKKVDARHKVKTKFSKEPPTDFVQEYFGGDLCSQSIVAPTIAENSKVDGWKVVDEGAAVKKPSVAEKTSTTENEPITLKQILIGVSKLLVICGNILHLMTPRLAKFKHLPFPAKTLDELHGIEKRLSREPEFRKEVVSFIVSRKILMTSTLDKNFLKEFLCDAVTIKMNWSGGHGKLSISKTKLFGELIPCELCHSEFTESMFKREMRKQIAEAHDRIWKKPKAARQKELNKMKTKM